MKLNIGLESSDSLTKISLISGPELGSDASKLPIRRFSTSKLWITSVLRAWDLRYKITDANLLQMDHLSGRRIGESVTALQFARKTPGYNIQRLSNI